MSEVPAGNFHGYLVTVYTIPGYSITDTLFQAIMMMCVIGCQAETMGDKANAFNMYNKILNLIKYVMKLTASKNAKEKINIRYFGQVPVLYKSAIFESISAKSKII